MHAGLSDGMRFFFHIADRYGVSPDAVGCEFAEQDAAVLHARRLAAELAKSGAFFCGSFVLVARVAESASWRADADEAPAASLES